MKYDIILIYIAQRNNYQEILICKRNRKPEIGKWSLPGGIGGLDYNPDPHQAIKDEVKMDFDVEFVNYNLFHVKYDDKSAPSLRLYFTGKFNREPKNNSPETMSDFKWVSVDEAIKLPLAFEDVDDPVLEIYKDKFLKNG